MRLTPSERSVARSLTDTSRGFILLLSLYSQLALTRYVRCCPPFGESLLLNLDPLLLKKHHCGISKMSRSISKKLYRVQQVADLGCDLIFSD